MIGDRFEGCCTTRTSSAPGEILAVRCPSHRRTTAGVNRRQFTWSRQTSVAAGAAPGEQVAQQPWGDVVATRGSPTRIVPETGGIAPVRGLAGRPSGCCERVPSCGQPATVTTQGLTGSLRHEAKSGTFIWPRLGTELATSGDLFMATDNGRGDPARTAGNRVAGDRRTTIGGSGPETSADLSPPVPPPRSAGSARRRDPRRTGGCPECHQPRR